MLQHEIKLLNEVNKLIKNFLKIECALVRDSHLEIDFHRYKLLFDKNQLHPYISKDQLERYSCMLNGINLSTKVTIDQYYDKTTMTKTEKSKIGLLYRLELFEKPLYPQQLVINNTLEEIMTAFKKANVRRIENALCLWNVIPDSLISSNIIDIVSSYIAKQGGARARDEVCTTTISIDTAGHCHCRPITG